MFLNHDPGNDVHLPLKDGGFIKRRYKRKIEAKD